MTFFRRGLDLINFDEAKKISKKIFLNVQTYSNMENN